MLCFGLVMSLKWICRYLGLKATDSVGVWCTTETPRRLISELPKLCTRLFISLFVCIFVLLIWAAGCVKMVYMNRIMRIEAFYQSMAWLYTIHRQGNICILITKNSLLPGNVWVVCYTIFFLKNIFPRFSGLLTSCVTLKVSAESDLKRYDFSVHPENEWTSPVQDKRHHKTSTELSKVLACLLLLSQAANQEKYFFYGPYDPSNPHTALL